jgi:hypothetical protein
MMEQDHIDELTIIGRAKEERARVRALKKLKGVKLYIITCAELWPVKIGITLNPTTRLSQIQNGNWIKLHIHRIFLFPSNIAYLLEQELHGKLQSKTLSGEWFGVKASEAERVVEEVLANHGLGLKG